jgi:hypothetical protein
VIQRRTSLKAQGAAKKGCGKVLQSSFFFRAYRNPLPAAKKVRAIEIAIEFCLTKCAPPIPVLCVCTSSPQRLIKATYPPPGHETRRGARKGAPKGDLACADVSTSCLVLSSCSMQPAIKVQEQEQPQLAAGTERGTGGGDAALS